MKIRVLSGKEGKEENARNKARTKAAEDAFDRIWRKELVEMREFVLRSCPQSSYKPHHSPGEYKKRKAAYMAACRNKWLIEDSVKRQQESAA